MSVRKSISISLIVIVILLAAQYFLSNRPTRNAGNVEQFINSQDGLLPDRKLSLERYAKFIQAILDDKEFDEHREIACINELGGIAGEYDPKFRELELIVKGKVLNTPAKIRKYYEHDAKFSGQILTFPQVTREECLP